MNYQEVSKIARRRIHKYRSYLIEISDWEDAIGCHVENETGIHGSGISDQTARLALQMAEPPKRIRAMRRWVCAIDKAYEYVREEDAAYGRDAGMAYMMRTYYCMDADSRPRDENAKARMEIAETCGVTERTLYMWQRHIVDVVIYYYMHNKKGTA